MTECKIAMDLIGKKKGVITMGQYSASIVPDPTLMKKLGSLSGTNISKILELVDNAVDAKVEGKPVKVDVTIVKNADRSYIEVNDDGCGMSEEVARSFFQIAKSEKEGRQKIGRFGMGSKVAIIGLGDTCTVETKEEGATHSVRIAFDIRTFQNWEVDYEVREDTDAWHGTRIVVDNLTVRIGDVAKFADRLIDHVSKTYTHFIRQGEAVMTVNGKPVPPHTIDLLPDFHQSFDFTVNGKRVHGYAGAAKDAATNWKFGLDLISYGRIIKSHDLLGRPAHPSLSRLVGEIHLDDFPTDIHKTDFNRSTDEWSRMADRLLNVELRELLKRISTLTNRDVFRRYEKEMYQVSTTLNKLFSNSDFLHRLDIDDGVVKTLKDRVSKRKTERRVRTPQPKDKQEGTEEKKQRRRQLTYPLLISEPIGLSLGEHHPSRRWMVYEEGGQSVINVEVNLDHPTYQEEGEVPLHMRGAVVDSVAEFLLQEEKKQGMIEGEVERFNEIKDMIIRYSITV